MIYDICSLNKGPNQINPECQIRHKEDVNYCHTLF